MEEGEGMPQGDFIVFVDESGDHGLARIDPNYPVFVLAFCIFRKSDYGNTIVPAVVKLKLDYFGHDQVVLHEAEIRKKKGPFTFLNEPAQCDRFHADLNALVGAAPFIVAAVGLRKQQLADRDALSANPYHLAMARGLERVCRFLGENGQEGKLTHFIFECRGKREDMDLELEFRRVTGPGTATCRGIPAEIIMSDKKTISTGLQIADLIARPIGLKILRPDQPNRAYEIIERKLLRGPAGSGEWWD
jgi:hypothetical protein